MIPEGHPLFARMRRAAPRISTRVLVHGVDGVGKTSFAKSAPKPAFICPENVELPNWIPSFVPQSWEEYVWILSNFYNDALGYESLVVDTVDWLYPKTVMYVCQRDNAACKHKLILQDGSPYLEGYGYGKGPSVVAQEWQRCLELLDSIRMRHGMNIVLLTHSGRHRVKNPGGDDFDIIEPNLDRETTDLLCRWPDTVLYAEFYREAIKVDDDKRGKSSTKKMIANGARICWTQYRGAHRAKNRSGMPEAISLDWREFARYALADLDALRGQIAEKLATINDRGVEAKVHQWIAQQRDEAGPLLQTLEKLDEIIASKQRPAEPTTFVQE